jgi:hypothetical protein
MGLLDDAIREHLDLKRRRGADPDEVARLEHEALGPVRREPVQSESAPAEAAAAEHHEPAPMPTASDATRVLAPEDRHEPPHGDKLHDEHAHQPELGGAAAPAAAHEPEDADRAEPARSTVEPEPEKAHGDELKQDPRLSDIVHQPTTEFRVEDHHDDHYDEDEHPRGEQRPAKSRADDDVLEETPDFLQETPEHDRLWFEQRPPRDFDFDG